MKDNNTGFRCAACNKSFHAYSIGEDELESLCAKCRSFETWEESDDLTGWVDQLHTGGSLTIEDT